MFSTPESQFKKVKSKYIYIHLSNLIFNIFKKHARTPSQIDTSDFKALTKLGKSKIFLCYLTHL